MAKGDLPEGEEYRGPAGAMKDSRFLSAECLPEAVQGGKPVDVLVEIEKVLMRRNFEMFRGGRAEFHRVGGFIKFKGRDKELKLNATNTKTLVRLFGRDTGAWFGKKVVLYIDRIPPPGNQ